MGSPYVSIQKLYARDKLRLAFVDKPKGSSVFRLKRVPMGVVFSASSFLKIYGLTNKSITFKEEIGQGSNIFLGEY